MMNNQSFVSHNNQTVSHLTRFTAIENEQDIEQRKIIDKQLKKLYYAPIAFVI